MQVFARDGSCFRLTHLACTCASTLTANFRTWQRQQLRLSHFALTSIFSFHLSLLHLSLLYFTIISTIPIVNEFKKLPPHNEKQITHSVRDLRPESTTSKPFLHVIRSSNGTPLQGRADCGLQKL
ncbi:hypothetical protein MRB53_037532 [Persea americana]|nr:hypothetical protein MRB53_037532 [Persea americana]